MGINYAPGDSEGVVAEVPPAPTPKEVADACREVLTNAGLEEMLEEIERCEDVVDAVGIAFTALIAADVKDPEAFLMEKRILDKAFT